MAQHYDLALLKKPKPKVIDRIEQSIRKQFMNYTTIKGSLKWERIDTEDWYNDGLEHWVRNYYVGKGWVWGTDKGCFQVDYDHQKRKIVAIYMVA